MEKKKMNLVDFIMSADFNKDSKGIEIEYGEPFSMSYYPRFDDIINELKNGKQATKEEYMYIIKSQELVNEDLQEKLNKCLVELAEIERKNLLNTKIVYDDFQIRQDDLLDDIKWIVRQYIEDNNIDTDLELSVLVNYLYEKYIEEINNIIHDKWNEIVNDLDLSEIIEDIALNLFEDEENEEEDNIDCDFCDSEESLLIECYGLRDEIKELHFINWNYEPYIKLWLEKNEK